MHYFCEQTILLKKHLGYRAPSQADPIFRYPPTFGIPVTLHKCEDIRGFTTVTLHSRNGSRFYLILATLGTSNFRELLLCEIRALL
jgi:hypothetical protein